MVRYLKLPLLAKHGPSLGGIIEGCPAGVAINLESIQKELDRRKPGQSAISSPRSESDKVEFQSGIFEGYTTGTPIGFRLMNSDHRSQDYAELKEVYRPSHADFTYTSKYGRRDYRGGGRSSARETACRVVAGALAKQILEGKGIQVLAYTRAIGTLSLSQDIPFSEIHKAQSNNVKCPDPDMALKMEVEIAAARDRGDSLGGVVHGVIQGVKPGLGEPVFDKFNALLALAMMGINAVKAFEIGSGFEGCRQSGSAQNDAFGMVNNKVSTLSNNSGGIQGGISNGAPITFNVGFKPVATLAQSQQTVTVAHQPTHLSAKGRHDPCVVPRAIPIVEAMAALVTLDLLLRSQTNRLDQL